MLPISVEGWVAALQIPSTIKVSKFEGEEEFCHHPRDDPPEGSILMTLGQFRAGMRLPLSKLDCEVLDFYQIAPSQTSGNFWRVMYAINHINALWDHQITLQDIRTYYSLKRCHKHSDYYYFAARKGRGGFISPIPNADKDWPKNPIVVEGQWYPKGSHRPRSTFNLQGAKKDKDDGLPNNTPTIVSLKGYLCGKNMDVNRYNSLTGLRARGYVPPDPLPPVNEGVILPATNPAPGDVFLQHDYPQKSQRQKVSLEGPVVREFSSLKDFSKSQDVDFSQSPDLTIHKHDIKVIYNNEEDFKMPPRVEVPANIKDEVEVEFEGEGPPHKKPRAWSSKLAYSDADMSHIPRSFTISEQPGTSYFFSHKLGSIQDNSHVDYGTNRVSDSAPRNSEVIIERSPSGLGVNLVEKSASSVCADQAGKIKHEYSPEVTDQGDNAAGNDQENEASSFWFPELSRPGHQFNVHNSVLCDQKVAENMYFQRAFSAQKETSHIVYGKEAGELLNHEQMTIPLSSLCLRNLHNKLFDYSKKSDGTIAMLKSSLEAAANGWNRGDLINDLEMLRLCLQTERDAEAQENEACSQQVRNMAEKLERLEAENVKHLVKIKELDVLMRGERSLRLQERAKAQATIQLLQSQIQEKDAAIAHDEIKAQAHASEKARLEAEVERLCGIQTDLEAQKTSLGTDFGIQLAEAFLQAEGLVERDGRQGIW